MPRTRSVAWSELKLGVVGIVAMLLVTVLVVALGGQGGFFWQRYPLKTRFDQVNGLKTGAVVRLNGKDVGKVVSAEFDQSQVEVVMQISKGVRPLITDESEAAVGSLGLLGETIIDLKAAHSGAPLADWAYVPAKQVGGLSDLTTKASQGIDDLGHLIADARAGRGSLGKFVTDDALYTELQQFAASAAAVAKALEQGQGTLGQLSKDPAAYNALKASLDNLKTMTAKINGGEGTLGRLLNDDALGKSLTNVGANADQITQRLNRGEGTAGKLLTDQQLYDRFNSLAGRVDQVMAGLDSGRGTAGQLLRDQRLYDNMTLAASELRSLLADIRKDPKKYLHVSVSIF